MSNFIDNTDFEGRIRLPNHKQTNIEVNTMISEIQPKILKELLGSKLYRELIADLDGNGDPQTQKWVDLVNGIEYDIEDDTGEDYPVYWEGLAPMLENFCYYYYVNSNETKQTISGEVKQKQLNSGVASNWGKTTFAYNRGVRFYGFNIENIYSRYPCVYKDNEYWAAKYESAAYNFLYNANYQGNSEGLTLGTITDNANNTYTATCTDTKYMTAGDTVKIKNVEYTVTVVNSDTNFIFSATSGQTISSTTSYYKPFNKWKFTEKNYIL